MSILIVVINLMKLYINCDVFHWRDEEIPTCFKINTIISIGPDDMVTH